MEKLYKEYRDRAEFFLIYIREAHPSDGWQSKSNIRDKVIYNEPKTLLERMKIAKDCVKDLKISIPCLLDDMKNTVDKAYSAKPDRLAVIDINGKIAYHSGRGPWGFKPKEAAEVLKEILENKGCNPGTEPEKIGDVHQLNKNSTPDNKKDRKK